MADCTDDNHGDADVLSVPPLDPDFFSQDINFSFDDSTFADDFENFDSFLDDLYFPEDFPNLTSSTASDFINQQPVIQSQTCQTTDDLNSPDRVLDLIQSESPDTALDSNFPETKKNVSQEGFGFSSSQGSECGPSHPSVDSSNSVNVDASKENVAENSSKNCMVKRKKESEDVTSESRKRKHGKSNVDQLHDSHTENDDEEKKKARLIRNRESAHLSRQRKKNYVEELEDKLRKMHSAVNDLNSKMSYIMAENACLKQQLSSTNTYSNPQMAPTAPMAFPWVPYMPYFANPHGTRVPLLPIPKLPRKPASKPRTKKVASVSVVGLFFFILLIRGLVPMMNMRSADYDDDYGQTVKSRFNGTRDGIVVGYSSERLGHAKELISSYRGGPESDIQFSSSGNKSSEPLFASLYVRRNDSMVKIDGNLIIHSAMATEQAMAASQDISTSRKETSLALASDTSPAVSIQTALMESMSTADEGEVRKWFHEDLAGPMLSSGMCTEVFQFDVLPSLKTIKVPATSVKNISSRNPKTSSRNRRILEIIPRPIPLSNLTNERFIGKEENSDKKNNNSSVPSVVVSVLVDPKEANYKENGFEGKKSLSRVFVVLLLDGVKYVTYSCMIPLMGSSPTTGTHLVPA